MKEKDEEYAQVLFFYILYINLGLYHGVLNNI